MGLIWSKAKKWCPTLSEEEGVGGVAAGGGCKFSVGADKKGGASM